MAKRLSHTDRSGRARMADPSPDPKAMRRLVQLFRRNGYVRVPHEERRLALGRGYKKGWEIRLALKSQEELRDVRRLLAQAGLPRRNHFRKGTQFVQPIYGKGPVESFLSWSAEERSEEY